jgi:hypothetical protein
MESVHQKRRKIEIHIQSATRQHPFQAGFAIQSSWTIKGLTIAAEKDEARDFGFVIQYFLSSLENLRDLSEATVFIHRSSEPRKHLFPAPNVSSYSSSNRILHALVCRRRRKILA